MDSQSRTPGAVWSLFPPVPASITIAGPQEVPP